MICHLDLLLSFQSEPPPNTETFNFLQILCGVVFMGDAREQ